MKNKSYQQGFTLIEILIAILVLAVGMLGLAKLQGVTMLNSAESRMHTHAVNLAQDKIEELRNYVHEASYDAYASDANGNDVVGANATFTRIWTITSPGAEEYKLISVLVEWTGVDGTDYDVELTSRIAGVEPARSGMVLAAVPLVGPTAADSAAQAAAHAAAAAQYEAIVAASDAATQQQKDDAADALADAEAAADAAQDAADNGDAAEAAAQAQLAYDALQAIINILNTLPSVSITFSGTVEGGATSVTAEESGQAPVGCSISGTTYTCTINAPQDAVVTVRAYNAASDEQSCQVSLDIDGTEGCPLSFTTDCTAPWGETVPDGSEVTAYSSDEVNVSDGGCENSSEARQCNAGTLSGSFTFESCSNLCEVPNYVGTQKKKLPVAPDGWNSTGPGFISIPAAADKNDKVVTQSLVADSNADCTSSLTVTF
jgi:type IV pilus modification protein PilV